mmetsp:Transcript_18440/g.29933  ORF Transcript_18440/g.29933 Transcript_18440/m.29933 type:complete len:112 (+) Transcript_18440:315-650(+)
MAKHTAKQQQQQQQIVITARPIHCHVYNVTPETGSVHALGSKSSFILPEDAETPDKEESPLISTALVVLIAADNWCKNANAKARQNIACETLSEASIGFMRMKEARLKKDA